MPDAEDTQSVPKTVRAHDITGQVHEVETHQLRWRPSTHGIVVQSSNVLLLPQLQSGKYDLPGGGVEMGETLEEGLQREFKEETGLDIGAPKLVHAVSSYFKMPNVENDFTQDIMLFYECYVVGGKLSMEGFDEHERQYVGQAEWVPVAKLDTIELVSTIDWRPLVRKVANKLAIKF